MGSLLVEVLERLNGARGFLYLIKNEQSMLVDADACFSLEYGKEPVRRQRSFESGDELGIVIEGDVRRFPEVRSPKLLHKPCFPHLPGSAHDERLSSRRFFPALHIFDGLALHGILSG